MTYKNKIKALKQIAATALAISVEQHELVCTHWALLPELTGHLLSHLSLISCSSDEKQVPATTALATSREWKGLQALRVIMVFMQPPKERKCGRAPSLRDNVPSFAIFTWWDSTKAHTKSMITSVTHVTEHHFFFVVGLSTYNASLTLHTLPWVGLNHGNKLHGHVQARRVA